MIRTLCPLLLIVALAAVGHCLNRRRIRVRNEVATDILGELGPGASAFSWCYFLVFLLYPGCSFTVFSTFICSSLDDGTRYLRRDASIDCDDPFHRVMEGYATVMICVWPVGVSLRNR